jgi:hypothetical protein
MTAEKLSGFEVRVGGLHDLIFGATGVGDERACFGTQVAEGIENAADGLREIDEIGAAASVLQCSGGVDGADFEGLRDGRGGAYAEDFAAESGSAKGETERSADETYTYDCYCLHLIPEEKLSYRLLTRAAR